MKCKNWHELNNRVWINFYSKNIYQRSFCPDHFGKKGHQLSNKTIIKKAKNIINQCNDLEKTATAYYHCFICGEGKEFKLKLNN